MRQRRKYLQKQNKAAENRPEDGVRELQTLQTQILQQPAAADDALQSWAGGNRAGQVHLNYLQCAEERESQLQLHVSS